MSFILGVFVFCLGAARAGAQAPGCRCTPTDACWPSPREWNGFNQSVGGTLVAVRPVASVCHDPTYDQAACQVVSSSYTSAPWRSDQPGTLQQVNWETYPPNNETCYLEFPRESSCGQGRVSVYSVAATSVLHVQQAVRFATNRNLRLVIKNTGHDWLGRSSARASLQIWTHKFKSITFSDDFSSQRCYVEPRMKTCKLDGAVTIGAGVQLLELYEAAKARGLTVVAGGGGSTIGAAGGYIQGGGHSLLGNLYGASTDNVLEFTVVTASGDLVTANADINPDLYFALRGGGGGSYGVVTSVTLRTFPDPSSIKVDINVTLPSANSDYWSVIQDLHTLLTSIDDAGGSGFYYLFPNLGPSAQILLGFFFNNRTDPVEIESLWNPFVTKAKSYANSNVQFTTTPLAHHTDALIPQLQSMETTVPITIFGSRLFSRSFLSTPTGPQQLTSVLSSLSHPPGLSVIGLVVAGGQVSRNTDIDSALNPAWRTTLAHVELLRGWTPETPFADQAVIRKNLTEVEVPMLKALEGPDNMGAYFNEADPDEPNWQQSFWGPRIYQRLKDIKHKWDPSTLFVCRKCVGSEGWDDEGLCRV
ncbi:MAG: hypothetical protein M1816_005521 [Peltula sp. TS41687]|nr:MAG: hypothetical protein M1816_005521 [Peltula sp. TS41687]